VQIFDEAHRKLPHTKYILVQLHLDLRQHSPSAAYPKALSASEI
jgi:hypothetical protein